MINSLGDLSRGKSVNTKSRPSLGNIIDAKFQAIDKNCPIDISYQVLKIAYAVKSDFEGAENSLRSFSEQVISKKPSDMKAISQECSISIRSMAISILKIYLGDNWDVNNAENIKDDKN